MKKAFLLSPALAASVALLGSACADSSAAPMPRRQAINASAQLIASEGARLGASVRDMQRQARFNATIAELSRALERDNSVAARRALVDARNQLDAIASDADRDALILALDAAEESLSTLAK